jgi:thiamine pyrophosphate-dependent acetolactate synthase large subunit-like protein
MRDLVKRYLDQGISRRQLMKGLGAVGLSAMAARTVARALAPADAEAAETSGAAAAQQVSGTGGRLLVEQLRMAGVEYLFFNPSTGDAPIYDALADNPMIQLIKGVQEGAVVAMADGYARLSGKTGVVSVANIGLPNAMTQMVNSFKDRIPLLVCVAAFGQNQLGRDGPQDYEHQEVMLEPITKWYWLAQSAAGIPESTRRALKFAATPPGGPVFLSIPDNELAAQSSATVIDQSLFNVAMRIRPARADVQRVARMLIEANNPLLSVGDEVTMCRAEPEVLELAELLALPVAGQAEFGVWSKPFPTRNPLYIGPILRQMTFPGHIDVHLNLGNPYGERPMPGATLVSIRRDPTSLARVSPVDLPLVADLKLATADLLAAVKSQATAQRLRGIADARKARIDAYSAGMARLRKTIAHDLWEGSPISLERLGVELEEGLDKNTIWVTDADSGKNMDPLMSFGGNDKTYVGTGPNVLGWAMAAGLGAKLARPDQPVVAVVGDGSFLFSGPQPLWSLARYQAPVLVLVLNNRSYNNERNRIWTFSGGGQFQRGLDMTCYNGSPDVDFVKAAGAFGVEGGRIDHPEQIKEALKRGQQVCAAGRPYLLEIEVKREGVGAASQWYPAFSIAQKRTRKV